MRGHKTRRGHKGKKHSGTKRHQRGGAGGVPKKLVTDLFARARLLEREAAHMAKAVYLKQSNATQEAIGVSAGVVNLITEYIIPLMQAAHVPIGHRFQEAIDAGRK